MDEILEAQDQHTQEVIATAEALMQDVRYSSSPLSEIVTNMLLLEILKRISFFTPEANKYDVQASTK